MNKFITKVAKLVLGLSLAAGVGVAVGKNKTVLANAEDEVFYTLTPGAGSNNSYAGNCDIEISGITWNVTGNASLTPWRIGGKSLSGVDRAVYSKTSMGSAITKVELTVGAASSITVNSLKLIVGNDDFSSSTDTVTGAFSANSTITFTPTSGASWATGQYYKFLFNVTVSGSSNKFVEFSSAKFYRTKSSSSTYSVTYNDNGATSGDVPTDSNTYSASSNTVTVLGNTGSLVKTGHTFAGWNTDSNGEGTHYNAGSTFTISENITLYAEWSINQYTLTYNANGGSGTLPESDSYDYGTKVDVGSGDGLSNGDLIFSGWNTSSDGSGNDYAEGTKITIEGNTTLYAKWSEAAATLTRVEDVSDLYVGDAIAIVSDGSGSQKALSTTQNNNNRGVVNVTVSNEYTFDVIDGVQMITLGKTNDHWTFSVTGGYLYAASSSSNQLKTQETNNANGEWAISISDGVASIVAQGANTRNVLQYNSGSSCFACYASASQTNVSIYKVAEAEKDIVNSKLTVGTVSANTGDSEWTLNGFTFEVLYDGDSEYTDVTANTTFVVDEAVPIINSDGTLSVTVTPEYKGVVYTAKAATVTATLKYISPYSIERLYKTDTSGNKEVDGVYMGEVSKGYIFMNGQYGILLYDQSKQYTLTVGECYTLVGTISIYRGLYEFVASQAPSVLPSGQRRSEIDTPVIYHMTGTETDENVELQSRKTHITGVVTSITAKQTANTYELGVTVGTNEYSVFLAATEYVAEDFALIQASYDSRNSQTPTEVTIEGYVGWFDGFQINYVQLDKEDADYTIYDFSRDLLKETMGTCNSSYDGVTSNGTTLSAIWGELEGANYYGKLTAQRKQDLAGGTANSSVVVPDTSAGIDSMSDNDALGAALYRYDYCTAKYNLDEFIVGRTLSVSFGNNISLLGSNAETSNTITLIVIISMVSVTAIGGYFFLKKRREQN